MWCVAADCSADLGDFALHVNVLEMRIRMLSETQDGYLFEAGGKFGQNIGIVNGHFSAGDRGDASAASEDVFSSHFFVKFRLLHVGFVIGCCHVSFYLAVASPFPSKPVPTRSDYQNCVVLSS